MDIIFTICSRYILLVRLTVIILSVLKIHISQSRNINIQLKLSSLSIISIESDILGKIDIKI